MKYTILSPAEVEYRRSQVLAMLTWVKQRANVLAYVVLHPHNEESGPLGEPVVIYGDQE